MNISKTINDAIIPEEIFGLKPRDVKSNYRNLINKIHPDKHSKKSETTRIKYTKLFQIVNEFKIIADEKIKDGTYGIKLTKPVPKFKPVKITTKRNSYLLTESLLNSDICDVYKATDKDDNNVIFKVSKNSKDNDLVENEINKLNGFKEKIDTLESEDFRSKFLPKIIDNFNIKSDKKTLKALILPDYEELGYVSLVDVKEKYKDSFDPRHIVWIFKRLLMVAGYSNSFGITHGCIIPPHILVHPIDHSIILLDWSYSIDGKNKVKAISPKYKDFYPKEILTKEKQGEYTDIYMIAKSMLYLFGNNKYVPSRFKHYIKHIAEESVSLRPQSAWELHKEFDWFINQIYEPKYIELKM